MRVKILATLAVLLLGTTWPGNGWPSAVRRGDPTTRNLALTVTLDDDSAEAPFNPVITASVAGYFGEEVFKYKCFASDVTRVTPPTYGSRVGNETLYILDATCPTYTIAGSYVITVWIERLGEVATEDSATLTITEPEGQVAILTAAATEEQCTLPCPDQKISGLAYNGRTSYTWKADLDDSCASSTTACSDACWETTLGSDQFLDSANIPDLSGVGIKQVRVCVLDEVPSSAFTEVQFEALSGAADLACTASADPGVSASSPLDNVALEVDCSGGTSADGCDLTFDCDKASAAGGGSTLNTNGFETTGADGCDDATTSTGTTSCGGGTAQVGTGGGTTNAIFFHNKWVSAGEQYVAIDDMTIITDSSNSNQNRFNLRDDATNKYILQTANPTTNSLRLTCPGNSCTTAASQYVDGSPFDVTIHVTTANGRARLLSGAGAELCVCEGNAAADVDGFVLNGGQAVVSFNGVAVTTPGAGSDPTAVTANTTWPYNTEDEATENCDGYTTGTTTAQVTITCPDTETRTIDIPVQVSAAPTFTFTVTPATPSCTLPNCPLEEVTLAFMGTAAGAISGISCTVDGDAIDLTTTTISAASFAIGADGGWAGVDFTESGNKAISCTATRQGVTFTGGGTFLVNDGAIELTDQLVMSTLNVRTTTTGGTPTSDTFTVTAEDGSAVAFSCVEDPPEDHVSLSSCCGSTPATVTRSFSAFSTAGTFDTTIRCTADSDATNTDSELSRVVASSPNPGDPSWISGRASGSPVVALGESFGSATFNVERKLATVFGGLTYNSNLSSLRSNNVVFWGTTIDGLRGRPETSDCVPTSDCGGAPSSDDVFRMPWGGSDGNAYRSNITLLKWLTIKNAWFYNTTCSSSSNCPHSDTWQAWGVASDGRLCPAEYWIVQDSRFINSDSGQQMHSSDWGEGANESPNSGCNLRAVVYQNVEFSQTADFITGCSSRAAQTLQAGGNSTRSCSKLHANVPVATNQQVSSSPWDIWLIGIVGGGIRAGQSASNCVMNRVIRIGTTSSQTTGLVMCSGNTFKDYTSIEAARAAGETIPVGLNLSAAGWVTPPAGATPVSQRGDQD